MLTECDRDRAMNEAETQREREGERGEHRAEMGTER